MLCVISIPPFSGLFDVYGPHKDCIQSCCPEGSPEDVRGGPEEEAGERRSGGNGGKRGMDKWDASNLDSHTNN